MTAAFPSSAFRAALTAPAALMALALLCAPIVLSASASAEAASAKADTAPPALSKHDIRAAAAVMNAVKKGASADALKHLGKVKDADVALALRWMTYQHAPSRATLADLTAFHDAHPDLPGRGLLRARIESLMGGGKAPKAPDDNRPAWFAANPPETAEGEAAHLSTLIARDGAKAHAAAVRAFWVTARFQSAAAEQQFLKRRRKLISAETHAARLNHLLWLGPRGAVRRALLRVKGDARRLGDARYFLRYGGGNVDAAIAKVPAHLKDHAGLVFERMRWRRKRNREAQAFELLPRTTPELAPAYAERWWKERAVLTRWALRQGRPAAAYRVAAEHGMTPGGAAYADAEWLAGWIALRFRGQAEAARGHFQRLTEAVKTPVSRARAAYWLGRAEEAAGDSAAAAKHYTAAARHPTVYYGQLAHGRLGRKGAPPLPAPLMISPAARAKFEAQPFARGLAKLAPFMPPGARLRHLFKSWAQTDLPPAGYALAAELAAKMGRRDLGVLTAKHALRKGVLLVGAGWPAPAPPKYPRTVPGPRIEPALALAVIRQESAFQTAAVSSAGARGLMQLMPNTARITAKRVNVSYNKPRLTTDPDYNMRLGQVYLEGLINRFEGSYVLALAAYNAGPNRAKAWIKAYGDPRRTGVDSVDWVERIPFSETRNYVQRVMENLQVYRALLPQGEIASALADDLRRPAP
ncbi:MAG: lytic transglycosylase domain-containing protein [Rhodospirillales bacterium]